MATSFNTDRLILRPFRAGDLDDIYQQVYSDPDVCRYYCGATRTKARTKKWLHYRIAEAEYSDFYAWAVELRESGKVIGLVRLGPYVNSYGRSPNDPAAAFNAVEVELSFAFGQSYWGEGYALEACHRIIEHAFTDLKLSRLLGGVHMQNPRSARFHEKLGYRVGDTLQDDFFETLLVNPAAIRDHPTEQPGQ